MRYFVLFGMGVRIWFKPRFWQWDWYHDGNKTIIDAGPVTLYIGGQRP